MNKTAAVSIFAFVVLGIAGFGGYQYKIQQDLTDAIESVASNLSQKIFWCELAEDQPKHKDASLHQTLCEQLSDRMDATYASANDAGKKAGVESDEVFQRVQLAFANKMIADNCDTVTLMTRGNARCNEAKAIRESAETVLQAMKS